MAITGQLNFFISIDYRTYISYLNECIVGKSLDQILGAWRLSINITCLYNIHTFLTITAIFCEFDEILFGNLYRSIVNWSWWENGHGHHAGAEVSRTSKRNQKVYPLSAPCGLNFISK